jgi:hypothetical protein
MNLCTSDYSTRINFKVYLLNRRLGIFLERDFWYASPCHCKGQLIVLSHPCNESICPHSSGYFILRQRFWKHFSPFLQLYVLPSFLVRRCGMSEWISTDGRHGQSERRRSKDKPRMTATEIAWLRQACYGQGLQMKPALSLWHILLGIIDQKP